MHANYPSPASGRADDGRPIAAPVPRHEVSFSTVVSVSTVLLVSALLLASLAPSEPTSLPCVAGAAATPTELGATQRGAEPPVVP